MKPLYFKLVVLGAIAEAQLRLSIDYPRILKAHLCIDEENWVLLTKFAPDHPMLNFLTEEQIMQFTEVPVAMIKQHIPRIHWITHASIDRPPFFSFLCTYLENQWFMEPMFFIRMSEAGIMIYNESFEEFLSAKQIPNYDVYQEMIEWMCMIRGTYGNTIEFWISNKHEV